DINEVWVRGENGYAAMPIDDVKVSIKKAIEKYLIEVVYPKIDNYVETVSKPDIDNFTEANKVEIDQFTEENKVEIDDLTEVKKGELQALKDILAAQLQELVDNALADRGVIPNGTDWNTLSYGTWYVADLNGSNYTNRPMLDNDENVGIVLVTDSEGGNAKVVRYYSMKKKMHFKIKNTTGIWSEWSTLSAGSGVRYEYTQVDHGFLFTPVMLDGFNNKWVKATMNGADGIAVYIDKDRFELVMNGSVQIPSSARDSKGAAFVADEYYFLSNDVAGGLDRIKPISIFQPIMRTYIDEQDRMWAEVEVDTPMDLVPRILTEEVESLGFQMQEDMRLQTEAKSIAGAINENKSRIDGVEVEVSRKMHCENTIEDLKNSTQYAVGDVVEVLGYYEKGDGAGHRRQKKPVGYNGADAVIGADGSIWGIVHSGKVSVSWLGTKGDGVSNDSIYLDKKLNKNTTYFFDKNVLLKTSIDIPVGTSLEGDFITVEPESETSIFKLSRNNKINIKNIILENGYNGYIFELDSNEKARIENECSEDVNFPQLNIEVCGTTLKEKSTNIQKNGYILKLYCDGNNFGFYGGYFQNINGSVNVDGFCKSELYKKSATRTSWITGMSFENLNITNYRNSLFKLINQGADYPYEIWSFLNIQSQVKDANKNMRMFDFQRCSFFALKNITPWDWAPAISTGSAKPFKYDSCDNFICDGNFQGGLTYIDDIGSKLETFTLPNSTRNLSEILDLSKKITFNQMLNLAEGKYSLNSFAEFEALNCSGSNKGVLEIEYDFERKIAMWTVYFRTNGIQFEEGKSVAFAVIDKTDVNTNFNSEIPSSTWKHSPKKSQLYKDVMMGIGDITNIPDVNTVPEGFVFISTSAYTSALNYKIGNFYKKIDFVPPITTLDTPYHATQMSKLGILDSYHSYLTELHEYEKQQNSQSDTGVMNLNVIQPPIIPKEVEAYAKEYGAM
ncbi:MAG: hypothetical protein ACRCX7_14440, partial [Cetobacterium sp.]|uniref:hypothetical protein n=1 Tax=Cetobacterium sp. TaxID=2071632 RepID=UPI003F30FCBE